MSTVKAALQAASYECGSESQREAGIAMISMLNIPECSTVLDLGCGTGSLSRILSEKVGSKGRVEAVDPDGERVKIAREKYSASNIEYIQGNVTRLFHHQPCVQKSSSRGSICFHNS